MKCHLRDPKFKYFLAENPPDPPTYVITLWGTKLFSRARPTPTLVPPLLTVVVVVLVFKSKALCYLQKHNIRLCLDCE